MAGVGSITIISGMLRLLKGSDNSQKRTYTSEMPVSSNIMHKYKFSLDGITEYKHIFAWFNDEKIKDLKTKYEDFNFELTNEYKFVSSEPETNDNNKRLLKNNYNFEDNS